MDIHSRCTHTHTRTRTHMPSSDALHTQHHAHIYTPLSYFFFPSLLFYPFEHSPVSFLYLHLTHALCTRCMRREEPYSFSFCYILNTQPARFPFPRVNLDVVYFIIAKDLEPLHCNPLIYRFRCCWSIGCLYKTYKFALVLSLPFPPPPPARADGLDRNCFSEIIPCIHAIDRTTVVPNT